MQDARSQEETGAKTRTQGKGCGVGIQEEKEGGEEEEEEEEVVEVSKGTWAGQGSAGQPAMGRAHLGG